MKFVIYRYAIETCGDGCCSWSESYFNIFENGVEIAFYNTREILENESDFSIYMKDHYGENWKDEYSIDDAHSRYY